MTLARGMLEPWGGLRFRAVEKPPVGTMIIKYADDKKSARQALQALLSRPDCNTDTRKRIKQEIRNIQAGIRGEEFPPTRMQVHWGESRSWMVIHDLFNDPSVADAILDRIVRRAHFMELKGESMRKGAGEEKLIPVASDYHLVSAGWSVARNQ